MANRHLLLCIVFLLILFPRPSQKTQLIFLDVGQGDGIYLHDGGDILIDAGSSSNKKLGEYTVEPFLKSRAVKTLQGVFVTHADSDHNLAVKDLLKSGSFRIRELFLPICAAQDAAYDDLRELAVSADTGITYLKAGDVIRLKHGEITCLYPEDGDMITEMNDQSLILLYRRGLFTALFTGDAGKEAEQKMLSRLQKEMTGYFPVTVLKVGHHGSRTSTSEELLNCITPSCAILSYGQGNRYGHPDPETVDLLKKHQIRLFSTAEGGAVLVTAGDNDYRIRSYLN